MPADPFGCFMPVEKSCAVKEIRSRMTGQTAVLKNRNDRFDRRQVEACYESKYALT
jgi:hypothetical protein